MLLLGSSYILTFNKQDGMQNKIMMPKFFINKRRNVFTVEVDALWLVASIAPWHGMICHGLAMGSVLLLSKWANRKNVSGQSTGTSKF